MLIIAEDLQLRGVDEGAGTRTDGTAFLVAHQSSVEEVTRPSNEHPESRVLPPPPPPVPSRSKGRGRGHSRAAFAKRMSDRTMANTQTTQPEREEEGSERGDGHIPSAFEAAANQDGLKVLRQLYGSRAQTIINMLLAFDAYFAWFYPFKKSIPYMCAMEKREERALDNCRRAIDMQEMFERVAIFNHGSFLPHGAVFKVTRDILRLGDVHSHDLSALELQNAESKRVFESGGARHLKFSEQGRTHKKDGQGGHKLIVTRGYGATAATTTLFKLLATQKLRQGDGSFSTPASRRGERLFGQSGTGRSTLVKLEFEDGMHAGYKPENDTCLDAFIRRLEARVSHQLTE